MNIAPEMPDLTYAEYRRLTAQNAKYREALEFYADQTNWFIRFGRDDEGMTTTGTSAADADSGEIARKALNGESD